MFQVGRPTTAVAVQGSNTLFKLPAMPSFLFKEVRDEAEARALGGGIALTDSTGRYGCIKVGGMLDLVPSWPYLMLRGKLGVGNPAIYPISTYGLAGESQTSTLVRQIDRAEMLDVIQEYDPAAVSASAKNVWTANADGTYTYAKLWRQVRHRMVSFIGSTGPNDYHFASVSSTTSPDKTLDRMFAVVNRADHGLVLWCEDYYNVIATAGWLSTQVTFGKFAGPFNAIAQTLIAQMPSDIQGAATKAASKFATSPWGQKQTKIGIVSYFGNGGAGHTPQTGLALAAPGRQKSTTSATTFDWFFGPNTPTLESPLHIPTLKIGTVPGIEAQWVRDIATWHRFGECVTDAVSSVTPIIAIPTFANGWETYAQGLRAADWVDGYARETVAAGTPTDQAELALFDPSLSKTADVQSVYDCYYGGICVGDYATDWVKAIRAFYNMVESEVRG